MIKQIISIGYFLSVIILLTASIYLIVQHRSVLQAASLFSGVASHYDRLENEVLLLNDQRDQSHFLKSQQRSIRLEQLEAYVIAHTILLERVNNFANVIEQRLKRDAPASIFFVRTITDGETFSVNGTTINSHNIEVSVKLDPQHLSSLSAILDTSGMLTVYDVFTPVERQELLEIVLNEAPGSLQALEAFFATSILDYSLAPQKHVEQLSVFIASEKNVFIMQDVLRSSTLPIVADFLEDSHARLQSLWPTPMMILQSIDVQIIDEYIEGAFLFELFTQ